MGPADQPQLRAGGRQRCGQRQRPVSTRDPGFGDIRIGGRNLGGTTLASAYLPPPVNNYSIAGDFNFNTTQGFNLNATYDLFTVAAHEFGHGLGLLHATTSYPVMYSCYTGIKSSLRSDDIAGIRAIYSGGLGRPADANDAVASNGSFLAATNLTPLVDLVTQTALVQNLDLTTTGDHDYYSVTAPAGTTGSLTVKAQSSGLSMLMPTVTVYDALQQQVGFASGAGQYGSTLSVTVDGVTPGQLYYVKVSPAETSAFGTGKYALTLNFGSGASPTVPEPHERGHRDIYARRFDSDGVPQGNEFRVNTTTAADQTAPAVAMDDAGNFVVTWASASQDGGDWDVFAQRYDAAGMPLGDEFRVNTSQSGDQNQPAVAMADSGSFVVFWQDSQMDGSGWGIAGQRYSAAGAAEGSEFLVNTTTAGDQKAPAAAMDAAGNIIVAWESDGQDGSGWGVFVRGYSPAATMTSSEFQVNTFTSDYQRSPAVAMAEGGNFIVTWASKSQDGDGWGVYARRFNAQGISTPAEFRVNVKPHRDQVDPAVAMDASGGFLITWSSQDEDGSNSDVYARQYNAIGGALGGEFHVSTTRAGDQNEASVALNDYGHVVIVWSGNGDGDYNGVFTQRYAINGGSGESAGISDAFSTEPHDHEHHEGSPPLAGQPADATASPVSPTATADVVAALSFAEATSSSQPGTSSQQRDTVDTLFTNLADDLGRNDFRIGRTR